MEEEEVEQLTQISVKRYNEDTFAYIQEHNSTVEQGKVSSSSNGGQYRSAILNENHMDESLMQNSSFIKQRSGADKITSPINSSHQNSRKEGNLSLNDNEEYYDEDL